MLQNIGQVYLSANILVEVASTETLSLPALLDVQVGSCTFSPFTPPTSQQIQLFSNRNNVSAGELVAYFVRSTVPVLNGCAVYPGGQPGAIVTQIASPWTLAHEMGHVLGLNHCDSTNNCLLDRLMTGCGTGSITNPPPDLINSELVTMNNSSFTTTF